MPVTCSMSNLPYSRQGPQHTDCECEIKQSHWVCRHLFRTGDRRETPGQRTNSSGLDLRSGDRIVVTGNREFSPLTTQALISQHLQKLSYFLGISVIQNQEEKETCMGQPTYTEKLLTKMGMNDCKPVKTPADPGNHLVKATEEEMALDQQLYQFMVGSLLYLATCTTPADIAYAVGTLARFSSKLNKTHWTTAKRVLRYLKGTPNHGIIFRGKCTGYSDAKTESQCQAFCSRLPEDWSKKQDTVALQTAEAEYVALSSAAQESVWMRRLNTQGTHLRDLPLSLSIISLPSQWPGTHSSEEPSIAIDISSESESVMEGSSLNTALHKRWWRTC